MTIELRHRCRKCRGKLDEPTDHPRRAFCTRFCFDQHYRSRRVVCETHFRRRSPTQETCGHHECRLELRKYPQTYRWSKNAVLVSETRISSASKRATKRGDGDVRFGIHGHPPLNRTITDGWWSDEPANDRSLYDSEGLTLARIVQTAAGWELRSPIVVPRSCWADLGAAQRSAETIALMCLPDPFAAKHRRENAQPHPMGSPLNRPSLPLPHNFKIRESKLPGDPGPIPDFLRRSA